MPILSVVCYCDDCQKGGREIESLPNAARVLDADGGTPYLSYRDDRFSCVSGANLLVGYKIKDSAPTQRFVASCCNSGMFLKFGRDQESEADDLGFRYMTHEGYDGEEMVDWRWISPADVLAAAKADEMEVAFPTLHDLEGLAAHDSAAVLIAQARERPVFPMQPVVVVGDDGTPSVVIPPRPDDAS